MNFGGHIFPDMPDWEWLRAQYGRAALLHVDIPFGAVVAHCRGSLAYLATPYSKEVVREGRWCPAASADMAARAARWMQRFAVEGVTAPSPIVLACAALQADPERYLDPLDDPFWAGWCQPLLRGSDALIVPAIWGWDRSRGIWREVCWALDASKPVFLVRLGSEFAVPDGARNGGGYGQGL